MKKFFTEKQIYVSTFFGGPVSAGILIYKNFKAIGDERKAIMTLILTLVFSSALFWGFINIPEEITDKMPDILITIVYTLIIYFVYKTYFAKLINPSIIEHENKASNWVVAGYSFLGLAVSLIFIFWFAYEPPIFSGEIANYGKANNEIYYDANSIDDSEINILGQTLTANGFFVDNNQTMVQIKEFEDEYELSLIINAEFINNPELIPFFDALKDNLSNQFQKEVKIIIVAIDDQGKIIEKITK